MKFYCVCGHCGEHSTDEATIEFNFRDLAIYFVCSKCKKQNKLDFISHSRPLPKSKIIR